ncbi:MAG: hypothetical protein OZX49_02640 [Immundisolibacter sp.]|nr:hypothetical protein [Immundisolibacter sp.]
MIHCARVVAGVTSTTVRLRRAAVAGMVHAHVHHAAQRPLAQRRHRRGHAKARRQRAAGVAAAVHGLGKHRVGAVLGRRDDHVVGLGYGDLQLVGLHRLHVLAVGLHHGHRQAGNADVEIAHGRAVDQAQPHPLAGTKQAGPVAVRVLAVHQIGVGVAGHVGDVGRAHAHAGPGQPVAPGRRTTGDYLRQGRFLEVVVVALLFEPGEHRHRVLEGPVRQHHHVVAACGLGVAAGRVDHQRAVHAGLFLQPGMTVIPVRAGLAYRETRLEGLAGPYAGKGHARHAVQLERQQDAVPVDGGVLVEPVVDAQQRFPAFVQFDQRPGHGAVQRVCPGRRTGDVDALARHSQVELHRPRGGRTDGAGHAGRRARPGRQQCIQAGQQAGRGGPAHQAAACFIGVLVSHAGWPSIDVRGGRAWRVRLPSPPARSWQDRLMPPSHCTVWKL